MRIINFFAGGKKCRQKVEPKVINGGKKWRHFGKVPTKSVGLPINRGF